MGDFERDTDVQGADGQYQATLSRDWEIWGPNGGYVAAIALRAAGAEAKIRRPVACAAQFLHVADFAPVEIEVATLHRGRRAEAFRVSLRQQKRPVLEALVRTAAEGPGLLHDAVDAPRVPDPEKLTPANEIFDGPPPHRFWTNFESRPLHPERYQREPRAYPPVFRDWNKFQPRATFEDPFTDAARLLLLLDTLGWPAASQTHPNAGFMAPNLDVTAWFHRDARHADWLLSDHESPVGDGGLLGAWGRIFDRKGQLLASGGSQHLCTPREPAKG